MHKLRLAVAPLPVLLVVLFGALVVLQVIGLPAAFSYMAKELPDLAYLQWPMLTVSVLVLVCVQVVIVCTWKLLTMVEDDRIFSDESLAWVHRMVWAVGTACLLLAGVVLYFAVTWDHPGLPLLLTGVLLGGSVVGLLLVVMLTLLRQATTLRTDMEEVI